MNPAPHVRLASPSADPVLFRRITTGQTTVAPPPRRRARRLAPALVVTSLLGGAVAYAVLRDGVTKPQSVICYEAADTDSRASVVSVDRRGPVAACGDRWRAGVFGEGREVPVLVQCVLDTGVAAVFPAVAGQDVCARLALATVPSTSPPATPTSVPAPSAALSQAEVNAWFIQFREAVTDQFLATACMDPGTGAAAVRRELERVGLGDWTVLGGSGDGFSAERPCATLAFHPEERTIRLVPAPPRR